MYSIQVFDKNSKNEIDSLYSCLHTNFHFTYAYFEWKHLHKDCDSLKRETYCIYDKSVCVATLQIIVSPIFIGTSKHWIGIVVDGATNSDYRGLGLYKKLMDHVIEIKKKQNLNYILAFGNDISRIPLKKDFGFNDFTKMINAKYRVRFSRKYLVPINIYRRTINSMLSFFDYNNAIEVCEISKKEYVDFTKIRISNNAIYFGKDIEQLNWRLSKPDGNYKLLGVYNNVKELVVVSIIDIKDKSIYIKDVLANNQNHQELLSLLKFIKKIAYKNSSITKITFSCNYNNLYRPYFEHFGFKTHVLDKTVLIKSLQANDLNLEKFEELHFTRIDKNE